MEVPVTGHDVFDRKLHWKCVNINQLLISESKKRYMSLRFLHRCIDGRFASVSNTFMGSRMNSFLVGVEWNLERCNYLYIISSKFISAETWKLLIWHPINVLPTNANLPSMHLCKKSQGHIPLLWLTYQQLVNINTFSMQFPVKTSCPVIRHFHMN